MCTSYWDNIALAIVYYDTFSLISIIMTLKYHVI